MTHDRQNQLTHVDQSGKAQMVDVGDKPDTRREAVARGRVLMRPETLALIRDNAFDKGDVLGVARIASIMGAKNTSQLIPLCHPLPLNKVAVEFELDEADQRGQHNLHRAHDGQDRRRNGGADRRQRRRAHDLRYVQGR